MMRIEELRNKGIICGKLVIKTFETHYQDILSEPYLSPSEFMATMWSKLPKNNRNLSGKVFESLMAAIMLREGVTPLFAQAKIAFIPNVNFDFVLYSKQIGPVVLSLKTSLRERYKQADLEGMALKNVHRKSKSYLFTFDKSEAERVNLKIKNGEVLGIDEVCVVTETRFDEIIEAFRMLNLYNPEKIEIISCYRMIT